MDTKALLTELFSFLTRFPFVLISTQLVILAYAPRRRHFGIRTTAAMLLYCILGTYILNHHQELEIGGWFSFAYLLCFFISMLAVWSCFSVQPIQVLFGALSAYVFQNSYYYVRAILDYLFPGGRNLLYFFVSFLVLLVLEVLFFLIFVRHMQSADDSSQRGGAVLVYSGAVIFVVYVMHSWAVYTHTMNFTVYIFGILLNLLLLIQQFNMFERSRLVRDNESIERMLKMSKQQQKMTEENVALINRKCHDLKYQIAALRTARKEDITQELYELEESVNVYEHVAQTGNKTLDVVLTEKKLFCSAHDIKLNYMVEAPGLSVITSSVDLYSLFGNLIDNAIAGVQSLPPEKRIISLNVYTDRGFLRIHEDNWCEDQITFTDGLPDTKKDRRYHGYGTKSVRYIAEKYGGNVVMRMEENRFCADILIPSNYQRKPTDYAPVR